MVWFRNAKIGKIFGMGGIFCVASRERLSIREEVVVASRERLSIREGKVAGGRGGGWGGGENATEMHGIQRMGRTGAVDN